MTTVIINYGAGNVESVANALRAVGEGEEIIISSNPLDLIRADRLFLPGVGAFSDCMSGLASSGLLSEINQQVLVEKKPLLGICVGMQVMASVGFENGKHQGLNFISGKVEKIKAQDGLKIPHMGWNEVNLKAQHPLLEGIKSGEHFYFANSYHFICENADEVLAEAEYGSKLSVVVAKNNIFGAQFHPEKSGEAGLKLLKNFLNWVL
jgi:imidazole glycerol-phosphate synthase subunit HisH